MEKRIESKQVVTSFGKSFFEIVSLGGSYEVRSWDEDHRGYTVPTSGSLDACRAKMDVLVEMMEELPSLMAE